MHASSILKNSLYVIVGPDEHILQQVHLANVVNAFLQF